MTYSRRKNHPKPTTNTTNSIPSTATPWHESKEDIAEGLSWGYRKEALYHWVNKYMERRLTRRERHALEQYYLKEKTFEELGRNFFISPSAACRLVHRSLMKLRQAATEDPSWRRFYKPRRITRSGRRTGRKGR